VVLPAVHSKYWDANPGARQRLPGIDVIVPWIVSCGAAHLPSMASTLTHRLRRAATPACPLLLTFTAAATSHPQTSEAAGEAVFTALLDRPAVFAGTAPLALAMAINDWQPRVMQWLHDATGHVGEGDGGVHPASR
jgi:hypothetical protein